MRRRSTTFSLLLGVAVALSSAPLAAVAAPDAPPVPPKLAALLDAAEKPSEGEAVGLIVRYAPGVAPTQAGEVTGAARVAVELTPGDDLGRGLRTVEFDETLTAEQALEAAAQLEASPLVVDVQPNFVYRVGEVVETTEAFEPPYSFPTTQTSTPWGLGRIDGPSSPLDYRYTYDTTGEGVTAYIVDTGIRPDHVEFTGRLAPGFKLSQFTTTGDCNGHGTHVAGTVGGTKYGVAKKVTLVPVRVFGCDGSGDTVGISQALDWIIADHQAGEPAVINMSLGGERDDFLNGKVQEAVNDGITVVVAAGNDSDISCNYSPASAPNAITVNASTSGNDDASYSNFGACSDIYAPGSSILSADKDSNTDTRTLSGTSMAAPHVAGVVARILSHEPDLSPAEVTSRVLVSATDFDPGLNADIAWYCLNYYDPLFCYDPGRSPDPTKFLNAALLPVFNPQPVPTITGEPVGASTLTATVGSWLQTLPEPDVDPPLTYQWKRSGTAIPGATDLTYTLTPADVGKTITVTVTGNVQGFSSLAKTSAPTAVVTRPALGAPASIALTALPGRIGVEWAAPVATGGTISDYVIQYRPTSSSIYTTFSDGVGATFFDTEIIGLAPATSYYVKVAAKDEFGTGPFTAPVLMTTLTGVTSTVVGLTATPAPRSIRLDWSAPAALNGGTVTDYIIRYRLTGTTTWKTFADGVGTSTTATVTGLSGSRSYDFAVQARTVYGTSSSVVIKRSTLSGLASMVTALSGTASLTAMELTWAPPTTTNGGGEVTGYVIKVRRTGTTTWYPAATTGADVLTATVTGLARGVSYEFAVWPTTVYGTGAGTVLKKSTLTGVASAPTALAASARTATTLSLSWTAPATTNGGTITDYVVRYRVAGTTTWLTFADGVSTGTTATITGLTRLRSYDVNVYARTLAGSTALTGSSTTLRVSTLSGVPSTPTVTVSGAVQTSETEGQITLQVSSTADPSYPITGYTVQYRIPSGTWITAVESLTGSGGEVIIPGLILDALYEFRASATSSVGTSPLSTPIVDGVGSAAP